MLDQDELACCRPMTAGVIDVAEAERLALIFKALGDPTRVLIAAHETAVTCAAIALDPLPVIAVVTALLGRAYQRRVNAEEELLHPELPGYTAYSQRTRKLVPFIW